MLAAIAAAQGGRPADLRAARDRLDAAEARIPAIADPTKQAQARLFIAVRRADLLLRAAEPNLDKAAALVRAARETGRADGVWDGVSQEAGLLILWQTLPANEFFELVTSAPEDRAVVEGERPASPDHVLPLRLVRADLLLWSGREREAIEEWTAVSAELAAGAGAALGDAWADRCHDALVWHLMERREYARAETFVPLLRDARRRRYYTAMLANQRRDFAATERLLAGSADPRERLLLADALEQQGRFDEAVPVYEAVLRDPGADDEMRAAANNGLGDCYRRRDAEGDRARAEECFLRSLHALEGLTSRKVDSEVAENFFDLGLLAELRGDPVAAFGWFTRALDQLERAREGIPLDPFGAAFLESWFLGAVEGVLRTWRAAGAQPIDALVAVDRAKARSLLDRVASPRALEESPEVVAAVRALAVARGPEAVQQARLQLERARVSVGERTGLARPRPLDRVGMRAALAELGGACVLAAWLGERSAWLVVATAGEVEVHDLGDAETARRLLAEAYGAVATAPEPGRDPWPALDVAARFFLPEPVAGVAARAERLVFCPDDQLARLPFEALRVGGVPLGVRCEVERAPSLAVHALLARRAPADGPPVVVDSVPHPEATLREFALAVMRFSGEEGDLVVRAWPDARRLRGAEATSEGLRAALAGGPPRLLHLSSHAVTHGVVPSASLLLLADGAVPLSAFTSLPLLGSTVVLSACTTATGEPRGGEGDAGLLWGPLGAGARSVLASLWAVNQQSTCDLMGQVHHWLARGESEAGALRRAREALASSPNYAHPHYWAAFAAYGSRAAGRADGWWGGTLAGVPVLVVVVVPAFMVPFVALVWARRRVRRGAQRALPAGRGT